MVPAIYNIMWFCFDCWLIEMKTFMSNLHDKYMYESLHFAVLNYAVLN